MKNKKFLIIIITVVLFLSLLFIPFIKGKNIIAIINDKINYYSLSEERQAVYDKMKIEYTSIKSRTTGTAPFNDGGTSNLNGIDVSENDDYVRTFDTMKYTVEFNVIPNTDYPGVTNSSIFAGGVIKVRAKLPNQGTPTLMQWEQDAWMENVSYSNDKTEIYAEYHVPSEMSITNANQNLTFTIIVNGYKKTITSEMKPEFEIWVEGNKPDNVSSSADSKTIKDTNNTYISGDYSFDFSVGKGNLNNYATRNEKEGHYINYNVLAKLYQPYSNISDLRGVLYPTGKIKVTLNANYKYFYSTEEGGWITITDNNNILNGTELIAFAVNDVSTSGFYPTKMYRMESTVGGKRGSVTNSAYDSGVVNASLNGSVFNVSFENYKFDGQYPKTNLNSKAISYTAREGVFGVANVELYVPYYNPENKPSVDNQINLSIGKVEIEDDNVTLGDGTNYSDGMINNTISINLIKRSGNLYCPLRVRKKTSVAAFLSTYYYTEDAASLVDDEFIIEPWTRAADGPYYGGMDNLITWNTNFFELRNYTLRTVTDPESMFDVYTKSGFGFDLYSEENVTVHYGISKTNPSQGLTTNDSANAAKYEDFNWYSTYAAAQGHGVVAALYVSDPDNYGYGIVRYVRFKFHTKNNPDNIGKVGIFRNRTRYYGDTARTEKYYYRGETVYNSTNGFVPSTYDEGGNITSVGAPEELGESILVIGVKANVNLTTTDLDSSNNPKKSYAIHDGEINLKITPTLTNDLSPNDDDPYYNDIIVKAILPAGLSYHTGSSNKEPKNVTINPDGTTTLEWEYDNWQMNHNAPGYPTITFSADISTLLENNASLKIKSTITADGDLRDEKQYRTSEYGIIISNLAGSKSLKQIDKKVVEKNEPFNVTSIIGNNSQETLINIKTIEFLPTNNDENGSNFSGNYTMKVISLIAGQKIFYTTNNIMAIGLTEDQYGKLTVKDVDLENDSRWIEVGTGQTIPSNATAIATLLNELPALIEKSFVIQVIPSGNKENDTYGFSMNLTSDNLAAAIKTNIVSTQVVSRKISGKAYIDTNRNGNYDSEDDLLKTNTVKLLNSEGTVIKTTQTDNNGQYEFFFIDKGEYYVEFSIPNNYETISKGTSSKVNSDGKTDLLSSLNVVPTVTLLEIKNLDMGIRKKSSVVNVSYFDYNNNTNIFDSTTINKYYGDSYNIDNEYTPTIPNNYEFREKTSNYTGTVSQDEINVIYYYQKKNSQITSSITKTGTETITTKNQPVIYNIDYKTTIRDYIGPAVITIVDYLPYEIDLDNSQIDGGTYNNDDRTITWVINKNINSITEPEITISKGIEVVYKDVDPKGREFINTISGKVTLDNNEQTIENNYKTNIRIPGTIVIKYIEVDENLEKVKDIVEPTTIENLVGEIYTSEEKSFPGYELKEKPENEELEITETEQIQIYKYLKTKVKVETIVHGLGGNITGDEEVYYGEDSTKDKIVITSDEDYVIQKLLINGEEVKDAANKEKYTVNNFIELEENKLIEVTFIQNRKETVNVPNTAATLSKIMVFIGIIIIIIGSTIIFNTLYNKKSKTLV